MSAGRVASIHARLLNLAKENGEDFNLVLNRYGLERWLYRLSISEARERLWLKGAMLFALWFDAPHRPSRSAETRVPAPHVRDFAPVWCVSAETSVPLQRGYES